MSPGVTASTETGKETLTVFDWPGFRVTRVNPASRWFGTVTRLTGWWTNTGTMSVPATLPVFCTVKVAVTVPFLDTLDVADSPLVANVVYERPHPNGYSGLYPLPAPEPVYGSWSNTFGWSPSGDGSPVAKSPPTALASDGQVTGSLPLGLTLPKMTSDTAWPASVEPCQAISIALACSAGPRPIGR